MFGHHLRAGRYPYVRPYLHVRPSSASRSPSAYSALCCGQIAYPRAHIDTPGTKLSKHAPASSPTGTKLSLFSRSVGPTGTKLSQHAQKGPFQPVLHEQGELSTAPSTTTPSRENFVPRPVPNPVQNSPSAPASSPTGTKLSQHAQKGPFQHVLPEQGELSTAPSTTTPSRENFVPRPVPNPVQNSPNTPPPAAQPVQNSPSAPVLQRFREKVRPAHPTPQQNREKLRPAHLKTAFFASFAPAGRIFSRSHPHQAEQGELIHAEDLTGRDDGATLKPPTPLFTVDRPRSSHRLYGRHPRPRTRAPRNECRHNECHHNETRIRLRRFNRRVGGTSALLMPPTRYVESNSRKAQASLGATSSSASPRWICPLATGVIAPSFFLFVTTTGVMVS